MSRKVLGILLAIVILLVPGVIIFNITKTGSKGKEIVHTFSGVVDEVTAISITVIPSETVDITLSEKIVINVSELEFHKGDNVTVTYEEDKESSSNIKVLNVVKNEYSKIIKLYLTAIDNLMNEGEELNENIEYLAIDIKSFVDFSNQNLLDEEEDKILHYCSKYIEDIRENSLEELKEEGLLDNETMSIKGMVIYVQKVDEISENEVKFTIIKYVGSTGSVLADYTLNYDGIEWNITEKTYKIS